MWARVGVRLAYPIWHSLSRHHDCCRPLDTTHVGAHGAHVSGEGGAVGRDSIAAAGWGRSDYEHGGAVRAVEALPKARCGWCVWLVRVAGAGGGGLTSPST